MYALLKTEFYAKRLAETGSKTTEEERKKLSESHIGIKMPPREYPEDWGNWRKGVKASEETINKLSESHKGQKAWNKGLIKFTNEERQQICELAKTTSPNKLSLLFKCRKSTILKVLEINSQTLSLT